MKTIKIHLSFQQFSNDSGFTAADALTACGKHKGGFNVMGKQNLQN